LALRLELVGQRHRADHPLPGVLPPLTSQRASQVRADHLRRREPRGCYAGAVTLDLLLLQQGRAELGRAEDPFRERVARSVILAVSTPAVHERS
jgi:hypothetical protein